MLTCVRWPASLVWSACLLAALDSLAPSWLDVLACLAWLAGLPSGCPGSRSADVAGHLLACVCLAWLACLLCGLDAGPPPWQAIFSLVFAWLDWF
jgi:hypothetical protein